MGMKTKGHTRVLAAALDAMDAQHAKRKRILKNILIGFVSVALGLFFNSFGPYGPSWLPQLY
jgi:hypothetical protein